MMKRMIVMTSMLSLACGASAETVPADDAPAATSRGIVEPVPAEPAEDARPTPEDAPADVDALRQILGARHVADLPGAEDLAAYAEGEASLQWIALHADSMVLRVRALSLLQHFPTSLSRDFALGQLDGDVPQMQSAALTALGGQDLAEAPELVDAIAASLRIDDARVGLAALTVLLEAP